MIMNCEFEEIRQKTIFFLRVKYYHSIQLDRLGEVIQNLTDDS
jgi:hypothetical protein